MNPKIELIRGDITKLSVEAIVNEVNRSLLKGSGLDARRFSIDSG
jgi:O-acetyl-ADP-ribose deacetylase (regulator of RNase III)